VTVVIDKTAGASDPQDPVSVAEAARLKASDTSGSLYKSRVAIYPKAIQGQWRQIKWVLLCLTLLVYYVTPWIRWSRPGNLPDQAVLVDFTGRRFYFFFIQLWPQEVYFITGLLVLAALALFLTTALFGRLWCGYACPQTVWTDLFMLVERWIEGDRNARMRLDAQPWSLTKARKKLSKHLVWLIIAFSTGGAWIFYFHDAPSLIRSFWIGQAPVTAYVSCAILTLTTYALAGTMREQVCTYLCPWPRIQGAMLDRNSLQVTYRLDRGEPRGPHKKGATWEGRGDCVDCNQCVVVCPMGIDIRNGSQLECINCGLCIDACDEVMERVGRPKSLIAYDTDAAVECRQCGQAPHYSLLRPRTFYYAAALGVVSAIMLVGFINRKSFDMHVLRDRNPTFVRLHDGSVRDGYTVKLTNRSFAERQFEISVSGIPGQRLKVPGSESADGAVKLTLKPDSVDSVRLFVIAPASSLTATNMPLTFTVKTTDGSAATRSPFLSGEANSP
jgi:cytochrome c oxidase accessory protein FixG